MIREIVTISAVEKDCIWVEASPKSACGSCAARSGCGQRLLGKLMARPNLVRVPLDDHSADNHFQVGEQVQVGVREEALVNGAFVLYMWPLLGLLLSAGLAQSLDLADGTVAAVALGGLFGGAVAARRHALQRSKRYSPVLLSKEPLNKS
ncbi:MAG: SoxR reducing system RseC family protein [Porticoccaceae bacterium]|nr:SoxR reducing system RseC family protein [Porticoccaceae bacterium]